LEYLENLAEEFLDLGGAQVGSPAQQIIEIVTIWRKPRLGSEPVS
jgi:hypothetical protein